MKRRNPPERRHCESGAKRCGEPAPGTRKGDCDATVEEVRCQLPKGHQGTHAAIVEWPPGLWPGWPDGGAINGELLSREYLG